MHLFHPGSKGSCLGGMHISCRWLPPIPRLRHSSLFVKKSLSTCFMKPSKLFQSDQAATLSAASSVDQVGTRSRAAGKPAV